MSNECDSFTENLLRRTREREEKLKSRKVGVVPTSPLKNVLSEISNTDQSKSIPIYNAGEKSHDSHKPKAISTKNEKDSISTFKVSKDIPAFSFLPKTKEHTDKDIAFIDESIENLPVPVIPFGVRGLAALRTHRNTNLTESKDSTKTEITHPAITPVEQTENDFPISETVDSQSFACRDILEINDKPKVCELHVKVTTPTNNNRKSTNSRFAKLAENYNEWEDNSGGYIPSYRFTQSPLSKSLNSKTSVKSPSNNNIKSNMLPKRANDSVEKTHNWDKSMLKTLESAGFERSLSQKKVTFEFIDKLEDDLSPNVAYMDEQKPLNITKTHHVPPKETKIENKSAVSLSNKLFFDKDRPKKKFSFQEKLLKDDIKLVENDPAVLSLASRKALFEKVISDVSNPPSPKPEMLSVSAKTRLFETAIKVETKKAKGIPMKKTYSELLKIESVPLYENQIEPESKRIKEDLLDDVIYSDHNIPDKNDIVFDNETEFSTQDEHDEQEALAGQEKQEALAAHEEQEALAAFEDIDNYPVDNSFVNDYPINENEENGVAYSPTNDYTEQETGSPLILNQSSTLYPTLPPLDEINQLHSSPIKNAKKVEIKNDIEKVSTPIRTLSMYRREQKARNNELRMEQKHENKDDQNEKNHLLVIRAQMKSKLDSLRNEIELNQITIQQTSKAIGLCVKSDEYRGSSEHIEGEKILLIASQKRISKLNEIHRVKHQLQNNLFDDESTNGQLTLRDLKLPVKGEFIVSQVGGQCKASHYFLCLVKQNGNIISTEMLSSSNSISEGAFIFPNKITFDKLNGELDIRIEVYCLIVPKSQYSGKKPKRDILKLTPKKSKPNKTGVESPGGPDIIKTSGFSLLGYVKLNVNNCYNKRYDLCDFMYNSPLIGFIEFNVRLSADYNIPMSGYLNFYEECGEYTFWNRRWCVIRGVYLIYWRFEEHENKSEPLGSIDLRLCVNPCVTPVSAVVCPRENTFDLITVRPKESTPNLAASVVRKCYKTMIAENHFISADLTEERELWCRKLNKLLQCIRIWETNALQPYDSSQIEKIMK